MASNQNNTVSARNMAIVASVASVLVPVIGALVLPREVAVALAPLALAVPFITMSMLEAAVEHGAGGPSAA